ncbi:unnamed protein product [Closterium sp. NIES-53]
MGDCAGQACGRLHTQHRCFSRLDDAWHAEFGDDVELPRWADLLKSRIAIFDLDFDAILSAMYALSVCAEGHCYQCVPPDLGIAAVALGASESGTLPGTAPAEALHTFTLDSGASRCFFRDSTTLTPLPAPVLVRLADPSGGPVVARSSTVLPCSADLSGSLSGLHLPSFSTNLVSTAALQDAMVTTTTPGGSSLYTLATEPSRVATSAQVSASSQVSASPAALACPALPPLPGVCRYTSQTPTRQQLPLFLLTPRRATAGNCVPSVPPRPLPPSPPSLDPSGFCSSCDSKDGVSLFNLTSGVSTAPTADADSTVRSQWLTRNAAARLAVRNHLPSTERAHFSQYKSARALYDAVVARYSSPATAALSRLMLPYLFPDLAAFATVADLVAHLRTSDNRYRAALPTEFLPTNSPPMYITLYYLVTRLPDSLSSVRDHFLSLCPTELTVDLLEERLAAAEKSVVAVGASRGDCRTPFFEGCSPVPLLPSIASAAAVDLVGTKEVGAASAHSGRRRPGKGKGSKGGGGGGGGSGGGGGGGGGGGPRGGVVSGGGGGGGGGGGSSGGGGAGHSAATQRGGLGGGQRQQQLRTRETPSVQQLRTRSGEVCGLPHTTQRCFGHLNDAWRTQFPDAVDLPHWHDLLLQNVPIFDLDFDAILAAMYAHADIIGGDGYLRVPPDPGTVAAALGASASAAPGARADAALGASASAALGAGTSPTSGTPPTASFHTFTLDSGASRSFFRDSTTLTPLSRPVAVSLADPSGGPVLAHSSTVLPCPAAPSGLLSGLHLPSFSTNLVSGADLQDAWVDQFTPGGQRVTHCTCSRTGRHLATFTRRPGSSLYTLTTAPPPVAASSKVFAAASRSLPPLPPGPAPTCVPCVEGRQRAASHSSSFPPTAAPLQTLHMDVWGPARVRGKGHERYFLLVVDEYSRYTTVFPLRSKDRGGEFSSDLLRAFCHLEGIRQTVKRPPGSPPVFKARYVARGFSQRQGVDFFYTFSPTLKMTTLWVLLHVAAQRDYELHSLDFSTTFLQGSLHEEIWLCRPPGFTGSFPAGTQTTLATLGFAPSTADPSLFLRTDTTLPPFYVLVYVDDLVFATADTEALAHVKSELQKRQTCTDLGELTRYLGLRITRDIAQCTITLTQSHMVQQVLQRFGFTYSLPQSTPLPTDHSFSAPPSDESVEPSGPYPELVGCLITSGMGLVLEGRARFVLTGHADASWVDDLATQRSSQGYTFSLGSGSVSWRSYRSSSVLSSSCEAEIYAGAMAAQELRWLTYLLTNLGEASRSPPVLYQRGQLRLAYVASQANTADVFTKALQPCDHQPCFAFLTGLLTSLLITHSNPLLSGLSTHDYGPILYDRQSSSGDGAEGAPQAGLRQAPHEWHDTLRTTIATLGFAPSTADPSLFLRTDTTLPPFYVLLYVDDLVFATADTKALAHVKSELQKRHTCTDLGELTSYLGLRITRDRAQRTITLTQSHMVQQVLQRFGFTYSSPQSTPQPTGHSLSAQPSDECVEPSGPYPKLVGCLMYLMTCTRPDLAYPLSLLARYVAPSRHRKVHWDATKRVLRYLCSTSGIGLVPGGRARVVLTGHADASWVDDLATQRSSQGYIFSLGFGSVSWQSTRSSSVLSSSCEAEIYARAMAAQELRWLTYLLTDLGEAPRSPPVLYVDNKAMLTLCQEHRLEHRTKHIILRYFLARELQQRGQLLLAYVAS